MSSLEYRIAPEVFATHPDYCRGLVVMAFADNTSPSPDLEALLREAEAGVRASVHGSVGDHPRIVAWREAFRAFGAKPSEHRSSIEAMARRVVKPDSLPSINPLVDIGNIVSLKYFLPAGVHPLSGSHESLELRRAKAGDVFIAAGADQPETPGADEIVFASGETVLTRRWTWRQATGSQTLPAATRVFFNVDGLPPVTRADVSAAMDEIVQLARRYCRASITCTTILDRDQPSVSIRDS
ncbi:MULTISPECIES: B3/B4 domain-containing protein [unclassified Burkholderia]|uniref:B3/B4 domain-containing protein n=1 Tax=unclassified Burkholderia TaxID=2613784 RepID=UPI0009E4FF5C|nr:MULTISPECIES: phenylalanine--tRNA ligase beta subunit-related protein [unclassified Burkholderia]TGN98722.1 hypothetical protein PL79_006760 [Burkholderia sp. USMB20]